ncbi:hypothetical protein [Parasphingorhabdus halotolerans]|uniref:Uncharacterized protein n=1 Tax=Parasphingorhabdus halotolerans TaxID=2725558 RepID=A0A6H2DML5_9SPHN|nr:hypothetical protein [Parasphingorhabdus halotolerans]QJB69909.1 hypothetical protein HF685_11950 [Parasphingorhabdus halotolerans]
MNEAVVDRFVSTVLAQWFATAQSVMDHEDDVVDDRRLSPRGIPWQSSKDDSARRICASGNQITHGSADSALPLTQIIGAVNFP